MEQILYPLIGISIIFLCTTLGALFVLFIRTNTISKKLEKIFMGSAAGVMFSASFFSLLKPALETSVSYMPSWVVAVISTILGAGFLWLIDKLVPHFHAAENQDEGIKTNRMSKTSKMFLAVTIHNIPEGLSVGIAFGVALANDGNHEMMVGALLLAIGIGIQNIPEGTSVSLPIKSETGSSSKAFLFGFLSGVVEPIAAIVGLFFAMQFQGIMPWALSFAAGCMIYVILEEMVPELTGEGHDHIGVWSFMIGFVLMMALDSIQF